MDAVDGRALWVLAETQVVAETQEWVSDDAEPWRTECKESNKRFSKQFNSWRRCRFNKHKTEQQLHEAPEAAATATAAAAAAGKGVRAAKGGVAGGASGGGPHGFGIRACLVDQTPSTDPSPNGVIGAR